ncbi:MAG: hypothetical protein ACLQU3_23810 [Limisphaerales bacterium]
MPTEADICRMLVVPKLRAADWGGEPNSIAQQWWCAKQGGIVEKGICVDRRSMETRGVRWERGDEKARIFSCFHCIPLRTHRISSLPLAEDSSPFASP